jgi:transcriptional antiterminator NusG
MALEADDDFAFSDDDNERVETDADVTPAREPEAPLSAANWNLDPETAGGGLGGDGGEGGDDDAGAGEPTEPEQPGDGRNWFVIHCYSGYENKVRHNLEQRIDSMGMKGKIFDVVVPTEEEIEVKDGKRRTVERRVFPGYLLVQMIMSEDSWYVVRNTPGVTGFVGMGNVPTPLRPEEVAQILRRMEAEAPKVKVTFKPSQKVRIVDGPFNDFIGTVAEIDMDRAKVRVMVSFFGRETPVELDFLQVEKV